MYQVQAPAEMNETFARAFNSRKLENLLSLYEANAVLLTNGKGAEHRGTVAIAGELEKLLQAPGIMTSTNNFCVVHGEVALLRADYELKDGNMVIAAGSTAEIVRLQPDGRWLYVIDHAAGASLPRGLPDVREG